LNSLVSIKNFNASSVSISRYLRATGDEDSDTVLEFSGGSLRTVDGSIFKNL
jgi:hypothetical protein